MMKLVLYLFTVFGIVALGACKKEEETTDRVEEKVSSRLPESNGLKGLPGEVYGLYGKSGINWEPWTKGSLELAERTDRLVMAFIVWPNHASCGAVMEMVENSPKAIEAINSNYVPVLIDANLCREMALLSARLCGEVNAPFQFPLAVWVTSDGNPVAWIPLAETNSNQAAEVFLQSHSMVSRMWNEAESYVVANSSADHEARKKHIMEGFEAQEMSENPATDSARALRQLISLYDTYSRNFDEVGGLFPTTALDLLSLGARTKGLPQDLRVGAKETLEMLLEDFLNTPMFDPLDGGVFSSRLGTSWDLPGFYRDCATQARVVVSLLDAYEVTGNEAALNRAMEVLSFIDDNYKTKDGLFALGSYPVKRTEDWLWTMQDLSSLLDENELEVWRAVTGIREMGNLPFEVDPFRKYFRQNSFAENLDLAVVAEKKGKAEEDVKTLFESGRKKLLDARNARLASPVVVNEAHAGATFRMVSVYANLFRITGDTSYQDAAKEILLQARDHFTKGRKLDSYKSNAPGNLVEARSSTYALAIRAVLDVAAITGEERWRIWADDLFTTVNESFYRDGVFLECQPELNLIQLPIADNYMIFGESTSGLLAISRVRMEQMGRRLGGGFGGKGAGLPRQAVVSPMLYADVIQASLIDEYGIVLSYGRDVSPQMMEAILRSPLKGVVSKFAEDSATAGGKVEMKSAGGSVKNLSDPGELKVRNR